MSAEKELRGENGAFDTETVGFGGTSASVRPKDDWKVENTKENNIINLVITSFKYLII